MSVGVDDQVIEKKICRFDIDDLFGRHQGGQTILPIMVTALDFAFGLGCGSKAQGDTIEMESGPQLGKSVWGAGEEDGVIINVKGQRQAMSFEGPGEKVHMGKEIFAMVESSAGIQACGIIKDIEQNMFMHLCGQPKMGAGIVLPESAKILDLPAANGFRRGFVTSVWGEVVLECPAANAGAIGFKITPAQEFTGQGTVGAWRL